MRIAEQAVRQGKGQIAVAIRPQNGWALAQLAQVRFTERKFAEAIKIARRGLQQTPLAVAAVRTIAASREVISGGAAGEQAWQVASVMGWRDKPTQVWALSRALSNREADVFAMRADALLRTGEPGAQVSELMRSALRIPEIRAELVERLVARPHWRSNFLAGTGLRTPSELDGMVQLLLDLGNSPAPPNRSELRGIIRTLIASGNHSTAAYLDRRLVRRHPDRGSLLDDGGFDRSDPDAYGTNGTPFDWQIMKGAGSIDVSEGTALSVTIDSNRQTRIERFIPLERGEYRLMYRLRGDEHAPGYIRLIMTCGRSKTILGESSKKSLQSESWEDREVKFAVPPQCPLTLLLILAPPIEDPAHVLIDDVILKRG